MNNKSFFQPEVLHAIEAETNLPKAKELALVAVSEDKKAVYKNVRKAELMISRCRTHKALLIGMANFFLGYEGNYVLK